MKNAKLFLAFASTALAMLGADAYAQAANVNVTNVSVSGTNVTGLLANAPSVMYVPNDGRSILVIRGGASAVTATVVTRKTSLFKEGYGTITVGNETVAVPASATVLVGPFAPGRFNTTSGTVTVSMSSVVGVSATTIRLPQ